LIFFEKFLVAGIPATFSTSQYCFIIIRFCCAAINPLRKISFKTAVSFTAKTGPDQRFKGMVRWPCAFFAKYKAPSFRRAPLDVAYGLSTGIGFVLRGKGALYIDYDKHGLIKRKI
jgi:hypothetical protein